MCGSENVLNYANADAPKGIGRFVRGAISICSGIALAVITIAWLFEYHFTLPEAPTGVLLSRIPYSMDSPMG
jgi:hypothetical protein